MARKNHLKNSPFPKFKNTLKIIFAISTVSFAFLLFIFSFNSKEAPCANSISCINNLSGEFDKSQKKGEFMGMIVDIPEIDKKHEIETNVLGENSLENKRIYVNLTNQMLYAVEGHDIVYKFLISSGKWGKTPTGKFNIWIKLDATRMSGGSQEDGTFYDLPNVPWTMFFYNEDIPKERGYGIHGAYWHNNFGHPMSHGCINMKIDEAKMLYDWAEPVSVGYTTHADVDNPGTQITIFGNAPDY